MHPVLEVLHSQKTIDHTLLKLDATEKQIESICQEAITHNFKVKLSSLNFLSFKRDRRGDGQRSCFLAKKRFRDADPC